MKKKIYIITFIDGSSAEVWALTADQAKILAQAERINAGLEYAVQDVTFVGFLK
jgi:hypothetical protein